MNGVVNLLKPPGMTSQNAVAHVKRILGVDKAGHAGTLDPAACGVLPICLGRATKLADYIAHGDKEYIAELTLGASTDTLDSEGTVTRRDGARYVEPEELLRTLESFRGRIVQEAPAYSAIKVNGRPMYSYARAGIKVPRKKREVHIHRLELVRGEGTGPFLIRIVCSKGTYVRALLADIAACFGQAGYTSFLMRTRAGAFVVHDAVTFDELECDVDGAHVLSAQQVSPGIPLDLPVSLFPMLANGVRIVPEKVRGLTLEVGKLYSITCAGQYFGIGEYNGRDLIMRARIWEKPDTANTAKNSIGTNWH